MIKLFSFLLIAILFRPCINKVFGQSPMNKEEIYKLWVKMQSEKDQVDSIERFVVYDEILNLKVANIIAQLIAGGVDTLIGIGKSYPDIASGDTCEKGINPSNAYIFWVKSGKFYLKKVTKSCVFENIEIGSLPGISRYFRNESKIKKEYILPAIYSATKEGGKIKFSGSTVSHEKKYAIFFRINKEIKVMGFSENDISDKASLFYVQNRTTDLYKWFTLIDEKVCDYYRY